MKIVCISDVHTAMEYLRHEKVKVPECDILLCGGDMLMQGNDSEMNKFIEWFAEQDATHKVATPGNHDWYCQRHPEEAKQLFRENGCHLLIDESITLDGQKIYGSGWTTWFYDWAFNLPRRDRGVWTKAKACWDMIPDDTNILLLHGPPYKILDKVRHAQGQDPNVGCPALLDRIKQVNPRLVVFGHIHSAYGKDDYTIPGITFVNASICNQEYDPLNEPVMVECVDDV